MGFFDELDEPAPEPPPSYREPEWIGPPDNWIPATVALYVTLARTDCGLDPAAAVGTGTVPSRGPLAFVFARPAEQIPETHATIDADPIIAAASRAVGIGRTSVRCHPADDEVAIQA